jgi:CheY-like chemotaxis protein
MTDNSLSVLLVEDDPGDALLVREAFAERQARAALSVVSDGVQAMAYVRAEGDYASVQRPDLVLLDLNLPRKNGREVLAEMKGDSDLATIPVVVLTTSEAEEDILRSYQLHANAYITKPVDLDRFVATVHSIDDFFTDLVKLPPRTRPAGPRHQAGRA